MNELTVIERNGQFVIDSREVAEMTEVRHSDLLEKITGYTVHLLNGVFRPVDFFIKSSYQDSTGRTLPCYLLTRKGCDMVANKMTGEKGVLFTAAYVTKFEQMENSQNLPNVSQLSPQLQAFNQLFQAMANVELQNKQLAERVDKQEQTLAVVKDTFLQRDENWRDSINKMLNEVARTGRDYRQVKADSYNRLEKRAGCNLSQRLRNLKDRLRIEGATKTRIATTNRLDIIEQDKRLKEIYTTIVKEMSLARV